MPPKPQGKGGKGGGGKSNPADAAMEEKKEKLAWLNRQCESHERIVGICHEQLRRSQLECLNLQKKIAELNEKFAQEEKLTEKTCGEMARLYHNGKTSLFAKIETHQNTIKTLRDELDEARLTLERTKAEKDAAIAEKTKEINDQKQKMEEMAIAFGVKLKETLEQMSQYIQGDATNSGGGGD